MNKFSIILLFLIVIVQLHCTSEPGIQNDLDQVSVSWQLVSNQIADEPRFQASFTLTNKSNSIINGDDWSLFFSQTPRAIVAGSVTGPADIQRVNGDLYNLKPKTSFNLSPGDSLTITYEGDAWLIKETDAPIGLFFVKKAGEETGQTIPVTKYSIWPFENAEQYSRHTGDKIPFPDAAFTFDQNAKVKPLSLADLPPIIPTPKSFKKLSGDFTIDGNSTIFYSPELKNEANLLQESLAKLLEKAPALKEGVSTFTEGGVYLKLDPLFISTSDEAYKFSIANEQLTIIAAKPSGVFYGIQSLLALSPVAAWSKKAVSISLPNYTIEDEPQFGYRGMHIDLARNYNDPTAVKKLIDGMAFYKLNKLHLHLTDDEGWRLEIPGLPELTEIGSQRGYTENETDRLAPAYGSGSGNPDYNGSGYFTRAEFIDLIRYAARRHIEVIPEINAPGHARAAIKSMEARYQRLSVDNNKAAAEEFRLADPEDKSEYRSVQNYADNVICVCCEGTYRFYEKVVDEVSAMFTEAGVPLRTVHTGGDEVPPNVWTASPTCDELVARDENLESLADLPTYFYSRINQILLDRDLKSAGWEEIAMKKTEDGWIPHPDFIDRSTIPYVWNNLWGNQDLGYRLANAGYPVVLCNVTNLYFDMAYSTDPEEPGLYWGGFVDTRKAFDFRPYDIFQSTKEDVMGNQFDPATDYKEVERLSRKGRKNIIGIQGALWSESIKGPDMLEYYYFPKMLGLAERAWGKPLADGSTDQQWEVFANLIGQKELYRLDFLAGGYNYRLPLPGAKIVDGKVVANIAFPGLKVRYTIDGSTPKATSTVYTAPIEADSLVCFKAFDERGRSSRMVCVKK